MRYLYLSLLGLFLWATPAIASATDEDSVKVECLLHQVTRLPAGSNRILFFAGQLKGIPYVPGTLDEGEEETLVVHLDKADCTTFVETVLALALADREGKRNFGSYKQALQRIRYRGGRLEGYVSRLHYFSDWIKDNEAKGIVHERTEELAFSVPQTLNLNFMSQHPGSYRQLKNNPQQVARIARVEKDWQNIAVSFIPKSRLGVSVAELGIKDGDILAISTDIQGLDVVHTGFACWVGGKLHLLHASSVQKKVVLDSQTLFDYSKTKKAHTGVRVISFSSSQDSSL